LAGGSGDGERPFPDIPGVDPPLVHLFPIPVPDPRPRSETHQWVACLVCAFRDPLGLGHTLFPSGKSFTPPLMLPGPGWDSSPPPPAHGILARRPVGLRHDGAPSEGTPPRSPVPGWPLHASMLQTPAICSDTDRAGRRQCVQPISLPPRPHPAPPPPPSPGTHPAPLRRWTTCAVTSGRSPTRASPPSPTSVRPCCAPPWHLFDRAVCGCVCLCTWRGFTSSCLVQLWCRLFTLFILHSILQTVSFVLGSLHFT